MHTAFVDRWRLPYLIGAITVITRITTNDCKLTTSGAKAATSGTCFHQHALLSVLYIL